MSFSVPRGALVAVVGPTGAGKTTLLNALTGTIETVSGSVRIDGTDATRARRRIGYVPQDDALHPQLDVSRTLGYSATLRLPALTARERARRVDSVITELGLSGQVQLPVASLSGGQRKRTSVAVELLAGADVLVLDEPTSGLDPGYEKSVLKTLRALADNGRTVLAVTHSLKALALCDLALFLAPGGRVAFYGPPGEALAYFGGGDPADVFLALESVPGEEWKERFRRDPAYGRAPLAARHAGPADVHREPSWPAQLSILVRRYIDLIRSDRRQLSMLLVQGPVLGLLLWMVLASGGLRRAPVAGPNAVTAAVFIAISATWVGAANSVREIVKEQRVLRREQGRGLSVGAYVGSKAVVLGGLTMVQAAVLVLIATVHQSVPRHGAVLSSGLVELMVGAALTALAAVALGLLLSAVVNSPDKALSILPMTLVAQLVLSGGWASVLTRPAIHQVADLTAARWGVQAVEATTRGDGHAWWSACWALVGLTAGCLLAADLLLRRRLRLEVVSVRRVTLPVVLAGIAALALTVARPTTGPTHLAADHLTAAGPAPQATAHIPGPAAHVLAMATRPPSTGAVPATVAAHPLATKPSTATTSARKRTAAPSVASAVKAVTSTVSAVVAPVTGAVVPAVQQAAAAVPPVVTPLAAAVAPVVTPATIAPSSSSTAAPSPLTQLLSWWMAVQRTTGR